MNTMQLLAKMEQWREQIEPQLALVSEADLLRAASGEWSLLDKLAHLAAWDAETVLALARAKQGGKPRYLNISPVEEDKLNAQWLIENRGRAAERVLGCVLVFIIIISNSWYNCFNIIAIYYRKTNRK